MAPFVQPEEDEEHLAGDMLFTDKETAYHNTEELEGPEFEEWKDAAAASASSSGSRGRPLAAPPVAQAFVPPAWVREDVHQTFQGYISKGGKRLGRLYTHVMSGSYHVACLKHKNCHKWVKISEVPDPIRLQDWIVMQSEFESEEVHMGLFSVIAGQRGASTSRAGSSR